MKINVPNTITFVRTILCLFTVVIGFYYPSHVFIYIYAALIIHWVGDSLDGQSARRLKQETIGGAVFDIVVDRICFVSILLLEMVHMPFSLMAGLWLSAAVFCIIDMPLSLQFLNYKGIISPNYFYKVDRLIYRLNWSPLAKPLFTGPPVAAVLLFHAGTFALVWAICFGILKLFCLNRSQTILSRCRTKRLSKKLVFAFR